MLIATNASRCVTRVSNSLQADSERERQRRLDIQSREELLERRLLGDRSTVQSLSRRQSSSSSSNQDDTSDADDSSIEVSSMRLFASAC
jgi:hypothetical protein